MTAAASDEPPSWAFVVNPPGFKAPADDGSIRHVPDSTVGLTLTQVRDLFVAPDWHPADHPPLPEVVLHGRKPDVFACGFCHRAEGTGGPENSSLAGLPKAYILQQMTDFKSGARKSARPLSDPVRNMDMLSKSVTDAEAEAAADYFSKLKLKANLRIVETDLVPVTYVGGWHLADKLTGEKEPIGRRIIEVPEPLEQFVSRDTRARFVAYVPPGSLKQGRELVTTGGGKTVQCISCHGPDLRGMGPIPGIVGRSPSYVVRQLYDFQHGTRAGPLAALMKPTVEKLALDDMIALAAYLASLPP